MTADAELLDAVGAAFASLRRRTRQLDLEPPITRRDQARALLLHIVDESAGPVTVGHIAEQMSVDASVASRAVADAVDAGLLERAASSTDARQVVLHLSAAGERLLTDLAHQQRAAFERITRHWTDADRIALARLVVRYAADARDAAAAGPSQLDARA